VTFDPRDVVAAKRDGEELPPERLRAFILAYANGDLPDYLAAAFLMAAFLNGLSSAETTEITRAMVDSGATLSLRGVTRPTVDKHSTGGVSDGVTLVLAPLAAAVGLAVAKLSGRGLGHTGGTLDKLESIPGFRTDLSPEQIERQVEEVGCAIAAQSRSLVPADGALYALRDATATVASVPLIAASVMAKKLAVRSDLILLDVKAGAGAFMKTPEDAMELAESCLSLARAWNRAARIAVTDMSQPLGQAVGNALDVAEAVEVLRGERTGHLRDLAVAFVTKALRAVSPRRPDRAFEEVRLALTSGRAAETFGRMVEAQGGDRGVVDDPWSVLPRAPVRHEVPGSEGYLRAVDAEAIGRAAAALGAGRVRKTDTIDPSVGIQFLPKIGDALDPDRPVAVVHARTDDDARLAGERVTAALICSDEPAQAPPQVYRWLASTGGRP
jgi:pyrimidine-nucleoside phosphorylase